MATPLLKLSALLLSAALLGLPAASALALDTATARGWIATMKGAERGPFERIRWFCKDGSRLPPEPGACAKHGGGIQHGEWSARTLVLREGGYRVANVLAALDPALFTGKDADLPHLKQLLLERFLILADDGWILRRARFYRGALQAEGEQKGARKLLLTLLQDPLWRMPERFLPLREAARLLPAANHPTAPASAIRQRATDLAERDPGFQPLRTKLHVLPEGSDAERIRTYAEGAGEALRGEYRALAEAVDALYREQAAIPRLDRFSGEVEDAALAERLREGAATLARLALQPGDTAAERLTAAGGLMAVLRRYVESTESHAATDRLAALQAGLALEDEAFTSANLLAATPTSADRRTLIAQLGGAADAVYGAGLLSARQWRAVSVTLQGFHGRHELTAGDYLDRVDYLGRAPGWAQRNLEFHFEREIARFTELEPLTARYLPDRLRSGPLLFYSRRVERLAEDAAHLAGRRHTLFGHPAVGGLHPLNPGIGRGVLRLADDRAPLREDGVYLLPETVESLPPVAGILTRGAGNALSHIQLLARNLGIPNVVVSETRQAEIADRIGRPVVLAVSPRGTVVLEHDGPRWEALFGPSFEQAAGSDDGTTLRVDPDRLRLDRHGPIPLRELRATDSGRLCGPKAANLGELHYHYPTAVAPGVVLPFGAFRALLDQPLGPGGPKVFDWLRDNYRGLERLEGEARLEAAHRLLARMRRWIVEEAVLDTPFLEGLRGALEREFGPDGGYGVFVRSDTNVEDLPGFSGAGLNRTVPNVVGFEAIVAAIRQVWASPFTERAYAWRQARMEGPEQVYPAVLIQRSVPVEKSGVMITADIDSGDREWLSVAVNEGIGGAVAGQRAEELRIHPRSLRGRLIAQASAPLKRELDPAGGLRKVAASGREAVLDAAEIRQLIQLARELPRRFPLGMDEHGEPLVADVEFGFRDGRLSLFQIRPFVENKRAPRIRFLAELDEGLEERLKGRVALRERPAAEGTP